MFIAMPGILGEFPQEPTEEDRLLAEIEQAIPGAVKAFQERGGGSYIKVYPRGKFHWPWRGKKVKMWRLSYLDQPLWLAADGAIDRGEGVHAFNDWPDFCEPAEIEKRNAKDLERFLDALTIHHPCGPIEAHAAMSA
jgi:hypothetical protein